MEFDYSKLKGLMAEKGISQKKLAKAVGISSVSLNQKLNGITYFDAEDIVKIADYLEIEDYDCYFFTQRVWKEQN